MHLQHFPLQLSSYASAADYSPSEAAELSARLELLERLCRRFRARGSSHLLQMAESWSDQLEQYYASTGAALGSKQAGLG
jgi:DNA repair ATPase RecN